MVVIMYNKNIDGNMKQHTIITQIVSDREGEKPFKIKKHDDEVTQFNAEHNVHFTTNETLMFGESLIRVTYLQYTDLPSDGLPPLN